MAALTFLRLTGDKNRRGYILAEYRCSCGRIAIIPRSRVENGATRSCGCASICGASGNKLLDMTGRVFGRLTVLRRAPVAGDRRGARWECLCTCGAKATIMGSKLRNGHTRSCGCLKNDTTRRRSRTHGGSGTRLFRIWRQMRSRCSTPTLPSYRDYGARGITVCRGWENFGAFQAWAKSHGYRDDLTIDRIDNDGPYAPKNCRWTTRKVQGRNKRGVKLSPQKADAIRSDSRLHRQIAADYGVSISTIERVKSRKHWA